MVSIQTFPSAKLVRGIPMSPLSITGQPGSVSLGVAPVSSQVAGALKAQVLFAGRKRERGQNQPIHPQVAQYQRQLPISLDPFQQEAMSHLAQGKGVFVTAGTGNGKTLIANFAIEQAINPAFWPEQGKAPQRRRVFYTTPRKAISNEKFRDFQKEYGEQNVGLMTGDITLNPEAPIILMTTEVLRNMQYEEPEKLQNVGKVVFDECHFVNDAERGPVWEECIINMPKGIQPIFLSATVGQADRFVRWINAVSTTPVELVRFDQRAVPLQYLFLNPHTGRLEPLFRPDASRPTHNFFRSFAQNRQPVSVLSVQQAMCQYKGSTQVDLLPAVTTLFSKVRCDKAFAEATANFKSLIPHGPKGEETRRRIREILDEHLAIDPQLETANPDFVAGLMKGYGVHHAGMTYAERMVVEKCLKAGLLKQVWGTETLGAGINVPARTAVLMEYAKFDGIQNRPLTHSEFHQPIGRAGRRGMFDEGYVILVPPRYRDAQVAEHILNLIKSQPEPIRSKYLPTPTMVLQALKRLSLPQARANQAKSYAAFENNLGKNLGMNFDQVVDFLAQHRLITLTQGGRALLTPLGKDLSTMPDDAFMAATLLLTPPFVHRLGDLSHGELAALFSATLNDKDKEDHAGLVKFSESFVTLAGDFAKEWFSNSRQAKAAGVMTKDKLNFSFAPYVNEWVKTGDWATVRQTLESNDLYIGDWMNLVRRTANMLDKMTQMETLPPDLSRKLSETRTLLLQSPIRETLGQQ